MSVKTGLSAIANEVLSDIQKEAEALIANAKDDAKQVLRSGKQQANKNYETVVSQAAVKAEMERRRIDSATEVETRNNLLHAKEEIVNAAFEQALKQLKCFTLTKKYRRYLLNQIECVTKELGQNELVLQVNAADKAWLTEGALSRLSKKLKCSFKISDETGGFIGGFKTQTADGKIDFNGTMDNKFDELKPQLRLEIARILFGATV